MVTISQRKKRPQALFLSEQFVSLAPAIGDGGAHFVNGLLGRLSSLNKVLYAAVPAAG